MISHAEGIGLQTTGSTFAIHQFLFVVFPSVESKPEKEVPAKLLKPAEAQTHIVGNIWFKNIDFLILGDWFVLPRNTSEEVVCWNWKIQGVIRIEHSSYLLMDYVIVL